MLYASREALASLHICAGLPESSLLNNEVSIKSCVQVIFSTMCCAVAKRKKQALCVRIPEISIKRMLMLYLVVIMIVSLYICDFSYITLYMYMSLVSTKGTSWCVCPSKSLISQHNRTV